MYAAESSPSEYTSDRFSDGVDRVNHEAVHRFEKQGRMEVQTTKKKVKSHAQNIKAIGQTARGCKT